MTKPVRVLAILAPLVAWPGHASAQAGITMDCKQGNFRASSNSQQSLNVEGRKDAKRYLLSGDVRITCNDITVEADELESVSDEPTVMARGHVVFKETGVSITADMAVINRTTHRGTFFTVSGALRIGESRPDDLFGGLEPDAYFSGEKLEKTGSRTYVLTNGMLTTCTQPTPRWYMSFSGTITPGKHVFMRNLVLRVKNVPLLYLPAFYYPITQTGRSTGFLMPTYGSTTTTGFTLSNAFFWVLGRSKDATFFHNYFKKTGMGFGAEFRYLETTGNGTVLYSAIRQKAQLDVGSGAVLTPAQTNYRLVANLNQALPHRLRLVSRDSYFSSATAQQTYQQNVYDFSQRQSSLSGALSGGRGRYGFSVFANLVDTYTGQTSAQRGGTLPTIDVSVADKPIGRSPVYFGVRGTTGYLIRQDNLADPNTIHSLWRTDVAPSVHAVLSKVPIVQPAVSASWRVTNWSQSLDPSDPTHTNLPVPLTRQLFSVAFSVNGPEFSRVFRPKPNNYAESLKHTIRPSFGVGWNSPFRDSGRIVQLDPGVDGIVGGTVSMQYGVRTQLIAKRWIGARGSATTRREILAGDIRQSYFSNLLAAAYGQQDSSTGLYNAPASSPFSPVLVRVTGRPVDYAYAEFMTHYDTHFSALRDYSLSGGLSRPLVQIGAGWTKKAFIPGLPGYDSPDSSTNFLNGNATLTHPNRHLGGSYGANLDLKHGSFLNQRVVVYYNSQCCGISFDYQALGAGTGLPADRRFAFSFTLAGLGSFSNPFGSFGGS